MTVVAGSAAGLFDVMGLYLIQGVAETASGPHVLGITIYVTPRDDRWRHPPVRSATDFK